MRVTLDRYPPTFPGCAKTSPRRGRAQSRVPGGLVPAEGNAMPRSAVRPASGDTWGVLDPSPTADNSVDEAKRDRRRRLVLALSLGVIAAVLLVWRRRRRSQRANASPSGPSHSLLDTWATVADLIAVYQDRLAGEAYLDTAGESTDESGGSTVAFGDGRRGALPQWGAGNVTSAYRTGSGARGNVSADPLTPPDSPKLCWPYTT